MCERENSERTCVKVAQIKRISSRLCGCRIQKDIRSEIKGQIENTCSPQLTVTQLFIQVLHHASSRDLQIPQWCVLEGSQQYKLEVKNDPRSEFSNLSNWKEEA